MWKLLFTFFSSLFVCIFKDEFGNFQESAEISLFEIINSNPELIH